MSETNIISCEEALRLLAEHLDGELDGAHRDEVERHLSLCRSCFSRAEFEKGLKAQLGTLRQQPVESTFEERIRTLIGQFVALPEE
jgi:anti-sigma factor (TIGR02949 family)